MERKGLVEIQAPLSFLVKLNSDPDNCVNIQIAYYCSPFSSLIQSKPGAKKGELALHLLGVYGDMGEELLRAMIRENPLSFQR